MKLIPLDALVAELEKRKHRNLLNEGAFEEDIDILSFINTIEVKEVDLDAEWERYFEHRGEMATVNVKHLAKYFFELGMQVSNKVQKGEEV